MSPSPRKAVLPSLELTQIASPADPDAQEIVLPASGNRPEFRYFVKPRHASELVTGNQASRTRIARDLSLFPLVLDTSGAPWAEANLWLLDLATSLRGRSMDSFDSIAADLGAYRQFCDEENVDWLTFPAHKLMRPTYRFKAHNEHLIAEEKVALSTAKRRMASVIRFYRWLMAEKLLQPAHAPWKDRDVYIEYKGSYGASGVKCVTTTDISIKENKQDDPYDDYINDGGKLKPLTPAEQEALFLALLAADNTEMTLIHLFALLTGARIQTVLTIQVRHTRLPVTAVRDGLVRLPVGPGTGIDTKFGKKQVLQIPLWFYEALAIYADSPRAQRRRAKAKGGDTPGQYLFLSNRGVPLYESKADRQAAGVGRLRHKKLGQGVRQFMSHTLIPAVRANPELALFSYRFHDLRASFGMNLLEAQLGAVAAGEISLSDALNVVRVRMGHASVETTNDYLKYRERQKVIRAVRDSWEASLVERAKQALGVSLNG